MSIGIYGDALFKEVKLEEVDGMQKGAIFSICRKYRFSLYRVWNQNRPPLNAIGLNPSTATETTDDPTVRRLMGFARDWGYGGLVLSNIFSYRSTKPSVLKTVEDPVHNELNFRPYRFFVGTGPVLLAWGAGGGYLSRGKAVINMMHDDSYARQFYDPFCLGITKFGHPKHALYLPKTAKMEPYKITTERIDI